MRRLHCENSNNPNCIAAGISGSVCVNHLWPVVAGGGGMTKDFYFNTAEALDKAKADRDKPVTPVEYKPVISDAGADSNMLWPDTMYGLLPKGTGKITLHESKPAQQEPVLKDNSNYRYDPPVAEPVQSCYCPNCEAMGKELAALKAQPAPVQPIIGSYLEKDNSQFKFSDYESDGMHHNKPAVPDAFGTREGEHPKYIEGWNDCRAEMLKGMK